MARLACLVSLVIGLVANTARAEPPAAPIPLVIRIDDRVEGARLQIPANLLAQAVRHDGDQHSQVPARHTIVAGLAMSLAAVSLVFLRRRSRTAKVTVALVVGATAMFVVWDRVWANSAPRRPFGALNDMELLLRPMPKEVQSVMNGIKHDTITLSNPSPPTNRYMWVVPDNYFVRFTTDTPLRLLYAEPQPVAGVRISPFFPQADNPMSPPRAQEVHDSLLVDPLALQPYTVAVGESRATEARFISRFAETVLAGSQDVTLEIVPDAKEIALVVNRRWLGFLTPP